MQIEIIEDKKNPLLDRKEVKFKIAYDGPTPSRQEVKDKLVAMLNSKAELTILDSFESEYGKMVANGYVKVYDNEEALKIEPEYIKKRNTPKPVEVKEEAPAQETPAEEESEKPAEEEAQPEKKEEDGGEQ